MSQIKLNHQKANGLFKNKPIIGMIHLAGETSKERIKQAFQEITTFEELGIEAALIENFHGDYDDVLALLHLIRLTKSTHNIFTKIKLGLNLLNYPIDIIFNTAHEFKLDFIQLDVIAGDYVGYPETDFNLEEYTYYKNENPNIIILGGVWPKYYYPINKTNEALEKALKQAQERCEVIVVTGKGTGQETPLDKIEKFRKILRENQLLIVGAGLNAENAQQSFKITNGAIVGCSLKVDNKTYNPINPEKVSKLIETVEQIRRKQWKTSIKNNKHF